MKLDFLIIGAAKSASTFVHHCLDEHPDIYMVPGEVASFETPDYESGGLAKLETLVGGRGEKMVGARRPNYIGLPETPERIAKHLPEAKLVAVLRNPVDRAISAYFHDMYYGFLPLREVEAGMRMILCGASKSDWPRSGEILESGKYHKYLSMFRKYYDPAQMLILLHEEVLANPLAQIRKIYRFLDVDPSFEPGKVIGSQPNKVLYSLPRLRLVSSVNGLLYSYKNNKSRLEVAEPGFLARKLVLAVRGLDRLVMSKFFVNAKPRITSDLRSMLLDLYLRDIAGLEAMLGRDLSTWKRAG